MKAAFACIVAFILGYVVVMMISSGDAKNSNDEAGAGDASDVMRYQMDGGVVCYRYRGGSGNLSCVK